MTSIPDATTVLSGLDETGNRGNDPKDTAETDKRILAVLDSPVPDGYARWTGPLIATAPVRLSQCDPFLPSRQILHSSPKQRPRELAMSPAPPVTVRELGSDDIKLFRELLFAFGDSLKAPLRSRLFVWAWISSDCER
jgi:hypothetical protein